MARRLRHHETAGASFRRSAVQVSAAAGLLALLATGCQTFQKSKQQATSAQAAGSSRSHRPDHDEDRLPTRRLAQPTIQRPPRTGADV